MGNPIYLSIYLSIYICIYIFMYIYRGRKNKNRLLASFSLIHASRSRLFKKAFSMQLPTFRQATPLFPPQRQAVVLRGQDPLSPDTAEVAQRTPPTSQSWETVPRQTWHSLVRTRVRGCIRLPGRVISDLTRACGSAQWLQRPMSAASPTARETLFFCQIDVFWK